MRPGSQLDMNSNTDRVTTKVSQASLTLGAFEVPAAAATATRCERRTHVLFIIDQLCGMGGGERSLLHILRLLPKDRFRCSVVTFKEDRGWFGFKDFPCDLHYLPLERTYDFNAAKAALRLRKLIRSEKIDIVHTFFGTSDLWGGAIAKLSGVPVLISSRRDMGILRRPLHSVAYRLFAPMFDLVLTVSEEVRDFCIRHDHLKAEKVFTLHNAIDLEMAPVGPPSTELRNSLGLGGASQLICTVGHIRRVKGIDVLIRAAKKVCQEFPYAVFVIVGGVLEPDHLCELQELIRSLGLTENIRFLGPSEDVQSLLKISDVYCVASRSEGFSNALLEAMACGLPCVATRVGGNPEAVVENQSGFLVESEDPGELADRISRLLRNPALARKMGLEGRRIVEEKFTVSAMISRLIDIYHRVQ